MEVIYEKYNIYKYKIINISAAFHFDRDFFFAKQKEIKCEERSKNTLMKFTAHFLIDENECALW